MIVNGMEPCTAEVKSNFGFVALSKFVVANGMEADVKKAFLQRPHLVDKEPGFIDLQVLIPMDNPAEVWLFTYWKTESDFRSWHKSHMYKESHHFIPKGLKLDPKGTQLRFFEHFCS